MAFDGVTTKIIADELQQLAGARIDKVFQPNKNEIILGLYLNGNNYALYICIDSQNYRINLTAHQKPNPQVAPNFCMLLRKHLIGLKLKSIITSSLERIVVLEIEGFDDYDDLLSKKLIIELMGKHSNVILANESNIIIDSLRHIKSEDTTNRDILPHTKYAFPKNTKFNFFDLKDFNSFKNSLPKSIDITTVSNDISNTYNGISKNLVDCIINDLKIKTIDEVSLNNIYTYLTNIILNSDYLNLQFKITEKNINNKVKKDYYIVNNKNAYSPFDLSYFIDDFYYEKETKESFKSYRDTTLKLILNVLKKYNTRLNNINSKLQECENMDKFKLYGELITANLYKIENKNLEFIELENYYDNNNIIKIPLDKRYLPSVNAKRYYKKYNKLKNTLEIVGIQKQETLQELEYLESIVYELEASNSTEDVVQIFEEISENVLFKNAISKKQKNSKIKKSKLTKNKEVSFNPIKYTFDGFTVFVGRNNKENDYLTLKFASKTDLWFHTKEIHGSHVILKISDNIPTDDILYKCAKLAVEHSKGKNSSNVPVDYCQVKYVKKPNGAKPGMVIYTNNKTIYVK